MTIRIWKPTRPYVKATGYTGPGAAWLDCSYSKTASPSPVWFKIFIVLQKSSLGRICLHCGDFVMNWEIYHLFPNKRVKFLNWLINRWKLRILPKLKKNTVKQINKQTNKQTKTNNNSALKLEEIKMLEDWNLLVPFSQVNLRN